MNNNDLIHCSRISVDCVVNDPVDVKCGGPEFLGFDFNVKKEQVEEMKKVVYLTLKELEVPLINVGISDTIDLPEKDVWTKEKIIEAISSDASYLKSEASRNYTLSLAK